jgi:hypothetical protein
VEAEQFGRTALSQNPDDVFALNLLGGALTDQAATHPAKAEEAAECFERVQELGGSVPRQLLITLEKVIMDSELRGVEKTAQRVRAIRDAFDNAQR